MRIVIAPDKFKGSLNADGVAQHVARGLAAVLPDAELVRVPVADGGDGTVQAALAAGFARQTVTVTGPLGDPVQAELALGDGHGVGAAGMRTAVVELATASGLGVLPRDPAGRPRPDALRATSRGTGELVAAALDAGAELVVLGVGGSACTDGGAGLLTALGVRPVSADGGDLGPGGGALTGLAGVGLDGLDPRVARTRFLLASDVDNPLLGPRGAAAVFAPQKGADAANVVLLEEGLTRWRDRLVEALAESGTDASAAADTPGAGAAGGVGFAALAVLGAEARSGIELVLGLTDLAALLVGADLVITGEGSLDEQSLGGKAPVGVARLAARAGVPVVAVCGRSELTDEQARGAGLAAVHPLTEVEPDLARCIADPGPILETIGSRIAASLAAESTR